MDISLSEVLDLKGSTRVLDVPIELDTVFFMGKTYGLKADKPAHISLTNMSGKKIRMLVDMSLGLALSCDRCLEPVDYRLDINQDYLLVLDETGGACTEEDDESLSYINGYNLDLDGLVKEEVMIGFPTKVLCGEDCKGICKICGANLNKGECGCDRTELDPRMSKIRDIFNQKEV